MDRSNLSMPPDRLQVKVHTNDGVMTGKILIVEDEPALQETLVYNLARQGYDVEAVGDGLAALEAARRTKMDLIVLDLMLPKLDGFEVCRILRQEMSVPILMLTARDDEIDRVIGLEMGADDYLTKPFSMREMIARVKALIRRVRLDQAEAVAQTARPTDTLVFDDLEIDINRREVRVRRADNPAEAQRIRALAFSRPSPWAGAYEGADPGAGLGVGFHRGQPHGGCARTVAPGENRAEPFSAGPAGHGPRGGIPF